MHRLRNIFNMGGSNNCEQSEQTERLREAFVGVQGASKEAGGCKGAAPPCLRKFGILQAKYA